MWSYISNKATSLREKVLLVKNNKYAERTIAHLCGVMERKNILAETDYRFQNYCNGFDQHVARQQLCKHGPTLNNR
jgi:hypothetical protein